MLYTKLSNLAPQSSRILYFYWMSLIFVLTTENDQQFTPSLIIFLKSFRFFWVLKHRKVFPPSLSNSKYCLCFPISEGCVKGHLGINCSLQLKQELLLLCIPWFRFSISQTKKLNCNEIFSCISFFFIKNFSFLNVMFMTWYLQQFL